MNSGLDHVVPFLYNVAMEKRRRHLIITIALLIFFVAYVICAIKPLNSEYQITPTWALDVASPTVVEPKEDDDLLYFKFNRSMGYFTEDGRVTTFVSYPQKASISRSFYTAYGTSNNYAQFFDNHNKKIGEIKAIGFPFIQEDNIFVFLPGGSSFVKCNTDGTVSWRYENINTITAFDSSKSGIAVGFADGAIVEFDMDGHIMRRFSPGGSDYPAIHGIALSTDSSMIATICGQQKQRFVLAQNEGVNAKIIFHEFIDTVSPYQMLVAFYNDNRNVVYNSGDILGFVDTRYGKSAHIKIDGHAIDAQESGDCVYVLTKMPNKTDAPITVAPKEESEEENTPKDTENKQHGKSQNIIKKAIMSQFKEQSITERTITNSAVVTVDTVETTPSDVSAGNYHYTVYIVERLATQIGKFSFDANVAFIKTHGNRLYIGKDSTISCLTLEKN